MALTLWLHDFAEKSLHCSIFLRGKERILRNFARQRTKSTLFCEAMNQVSVILQGKERSLRYFARQRTKALWSCKAKNEGSLILRKRSEVCIAPQFYRANSALLQKYSKKLYFLNSLKHILVFQQSIAPWWPLFRKEINCRTVPMLYIIHCTLYNKKRKKIIHYAS